MMLLAPLAGLVGALLTFPALLFLYLLRLRRRPLTVSSTMLWEQASHDVQVNVPFRWIRPSVLLLLHLLILALFLLALARPAIIAGGGAARRAFFLIDVSASMQAGDAVGAPTRLDAARARAIEVARRLGSAPGGCSITVIAFAHDAAIVARPTDTLSGLRATLASIEPTDQPGRLEPALRLVESLLTRSTSEGESPTPPLVAVFSDGSFTDQKPLFLAGAGVGFEPVRVVSAPDTGNIAVVACSASRDNDDPARVRLFVRLQSTFRTRQAVALSLHIDGVRSARHALVIPPADSFGPGSLGRTLDLRAPGGALITCAIEVDDLLAADNVASVLLPAPVSPRVLLVHPDDTEPDPFLADALRELPVRSFRVMTGEQFGRIVGQLGSQIDLVVFDRVSPAGVPDVATITIGAPLPGEVQGAAASSPAGYVLSWDRQAGVMRDVSLDTVQIDRWLGPAPRELLDSIGRVRELALVREGAAIVEVQARRARHIVLRFELGETNWPLHFSFPLFLFNAVDELTGAGASRSALSYSTTEAIVVRALGPGSEVVVRGPENLRIARPSGEPGVLSLGVLSRAGVWRGEGIEPPVLAVNLMNAEESLLEARQTLTVGGAQARPADQIAGPRELWAWLVAAAGALLVVEWFLYAARVRV